MSLFILNIDISFEVLCIRKRDGFFSLFGRANTKFGQRHNVEWIGLQLIIPT